MLLSPDSFFNWQGSRIIIDIRPADSFVKGSLAGAISIPVESFNAWPILRKEIKNNIKKQPVHIIDNDGSVVASLLNETDLYCLEGGYKAFKSWRQNVFLFGPPIGIIAGKTGSGKTEHLQTLLKMGRQVIDLEYLAMHKGSVFGNTKDKQPAYEDFQNKLLAAWLLLDANVPVWMEEKGNVLGNLGIPATLYKRMTAAMFFELDTSFESRLLHIKEEYTGIDSAIFASLIKKLEKRMGFSANHKALHYHNSGQVEKCLSLLLNYYDKAYDQKRKAYKPDHIIKVNQSVFKNEREIRKFEEMILCTNKKNPAV